MGAKSRKSFCCSLGRGGEGRVGLGSKNIPAVPVGSNREQFHVFGVMFFPLGFLASDF